MPATPAPATSTAKPFLKRTWVKWTATGLGLLVVILVAIFISGLNAGDKNDKMAAKPTPAPAEGAAKPSPTPVPPELVEMRKALEELKAEKAAQAKAKADAEEAARKVAEREALKDELRKELQAEQVKAAPAPAVSTEAAPAPSSAEGTTSVKGVSDHTRRQGGHVVVRIGRPLQKGGTTWYPLFTQREGNQTVLAPIERNVAEVASQLSFDGVKPPVEGELAVFDTVQRPDGALFRVLAWKSK